MCWLYVMLLLFLCCVFVMCVVYLFLCSHVFVLCHELCVWLCVCVCSSLLYGLSVSVYLCFPLWVFLFVCCLCVFCVFVWDVLFSLLRLCC